MAGDARAGDAERSRDPFTAWRQMREREGPEVALIALYALVAEPRGLKPHELGRGQHPPLYSWIRV